MRTHSYIYAGVETSSSTSAIDTDGIGGPDIDWSINPPVLVL